MERIPEEVIRAYENSESYRKLKTIRDECSERMMEYCRKYKDKLPYFKEEAAKKLDHERYGRGMSQPRGRLCPGNMAALLIGGVNRGTMAREYVNPGYVYGYDKEDNLITSDMVDGEIRDREYIFWENPYTQVGLEYDELLGLGYGVIAEACYNEQGRITSYIFGSLCDEEVDSIIIEKYKYEGNQAFVTFIDASGGECPDLEWITGFGGDYIVGWHIVLDMDEKGRVLKYTSYEDMNPEEVTEGVPKYKLML